MGGGGGRRKSTRGQQGRAAAGEAAGGIMATNPALSCIWPGHLKHAAERPVCLVESAFVSHEPPSFLACPEIPEGGKSAPPARKTSKNTHKTQDDNRFGVLWSLLFNLPVAWG